MSNEQKKKSPFSSKKFRHGTFAVLLIAAVIVITVLLNVVVSTLDNVFPTIFPATSSTPFPRSPRRLSRRSISLSISMR